jgi:peptidoglycan/xylan/chitin deacetylase (PgdA/CDA1 family)
MSLRDGVIDFGFRVFDATRLHRAAAPFARGLGAILMFHRVRPAGTGEFAPNRGLEITPDYLDAVLRHLRASGFEIVTLDEALARLAAPKPRAPFVALTFDDGTRDTAQVALPVLERHEAPFTAFVTTGFADRTARMWWLELEASIAALDHVDVLIDGARHSFDARTPAGKQQAFEAINRVLRAGSEERLLDICAQLCASAGIDAEAIVDEACLGWPGIAALAKHPLVTIGAHTSTHPRLAKLSADTARREMKESRAEITRRIGRCIDHLAYPLGDPTSAGVREFALAAELGFRSALTTRPGMLFAGHARHVTALPRLSINGGHQSIATLDILLSGAPFFLMNGGRRLSVA